MFENVQETSELFDDINSLALKRLSDQKTALIGLLLKRDLVELVQKVWQRYFKPELLEQKKDLPAHLSSSLSVIHASHFCICNRIYSIVLLPVTAMICTGRQQSAVLATVQIMSVCLYSRKRILTHYKSHKHMGQPHSFMYMFFGICCSMDPEMYQLGLLRVLE